MAWAGSTRRDRLPADWQARRRRVLVRDSYRCQVRDELGIKCCAPAAEVDHVERGDNHDERNLQSICVAHHKVKTQGEAQAARGAGASRWRPRERHPGML